MQHPRSFVSIALVLVTSVFSCRAADSVTAFQNAQVRVTEETLPPGQSETFSDARPSVIVCLEGSRASIGAKDTRFRRGETIFLLLATEGIRNTGNQPLHFVRVAFLDDGSPQMWGMKGLPPNYRMVLENRYTRVYDIRIPAHFREPLHRHYGRVVICLSGATLEHILPDGQVQPSTLQTGEVVWRPEQIHVGHNVGNTALWAIAVEPK